MQLFVDKLQVKHGLSHFKQVEETNIYPNEHIVHKFDPPEHDRQLFEHNLQVLPDR